MSKAKKVPKALVKEVLGLLEAPLPVTPRPFSERPYFTPYSTPSNRLVCYDAHDAAFYKPEQGTSWSHLAD